MLKGARKGSNARAVTMSGEREKESARKRQPGRGQASTPQNGDDWRGDSLAGEPELCRGNRSGLRIKNSERGVARKNTLHGRKGEGERAL